MHKVLETLFFSAVEECSGSKLVEKYLREKELLSKQYFVVAIGKVAESMFDGAMDALEDISGGYIIAKDLGFKAKKYPENVHLCYGSHPLVTESSLKAAEGLLEKLSELDSDIPLLFLFSGGTSALFEKPEEHIELDDLANIYETLLQSGLEIDQINRVRCLFSQVKAGGLLKWTKDHEVLALAISDVPASDFNLIGSGPLSPELYQPDLDFSVPEEIEEELAKLSWREPIDPGQTQVESEILFNNRDLMLDIKNRFIEISAPSFYCFNEFLSGPIEEMAEMILRKIDETEFTAYFWGGEFSLNTEKEMGRGGRCQHFALLMAKLLEDKYDYPWYLLAGASDFDDGTGSAGACVDYKTWSKIEELGLDPQEYLDEYNSGDILDHLGLLLEKRPIQNNVCDVFIFVRV